jgi:hypothetical protein
MGPIRTGTTKHSREPVNKASETSTNNQSDIIGISVNLTKTNKNSKENRGGHSMHSNTIMHLQCYTLVPYQGDIITL